MSFNNSTKLRTFLIICNFSRLYIFKVSHIEIINARNHLLCVKAKLFIYALSPFIGSRIINTICLCLPKGLFHVAYDLHLRATVSFYRHRHLFLVFWRHPVSLSRDIIGDLRRRDKLIVELYMRGVTVNFSQFVCGAAYIDIRHRSFLGKSGKLRTLRRTKLYLDGFLLHMGDYHEEEKHRKDEVGKRCGIESRHLVPSALKHFHWAPPSPMHCSIMRCGQSSLTLSRCSCDNSA